MVYLCHISSCGKFQTNDFKNALQRAKDLANGLPGGELVVEEQEEIIAMLERIREHNKCARMMSILSRFLNLSIETALRPLEKTRP